MVSARFGADGMSLLLLPGEAECRSPPKGLQRRITTPGLKQLQGPKASVSGTNWSHPLYKSTSYGESSLHTGVRPHFPGAGPYFGIPICNGSIK